MKDLALIVDGNRGIYVPQQFAAMFASKFGLTPEQVSNLSNPNNDVYWETWEDVVNGTYNIDGNMYYLEEHDGDLFLVRV